MDPRKRTFYLTMAMMALAGMVYVGMELFGDKEQPARPHARQEHAAPTKAPGARPRPARRTATIRTDRFAATIDSYGGGVRRFLILDDERFTTEDGRPQNLITTSREEFDSLRVSFPRLGLPADLVWDIEQVSEREVRLRWEGDGLRIERSMRAGDGPFQIEQTVRLTNTGSRERRARLDVSVFHYVARSSETSGIPFVGSRSPNISHGVCVYDDEIVRKERDKLAPEDNRAEWGVRHGYGSGNVHFAAVENVYFVQAAAAKEGHLARRCGMFASNRGSPITGTLFESRLSYPPQAIAPGQSREWHTFGYIGPKEPNLLAQAGHGLPEVVDLGFFALIAGQLARLLTFIQGFVPNWGLAIILLTFLIRLLLFPLTNLSFKSMARMRQLKPEMDRINELYKDEQEKKGAAIMELYRKHKINPLSGCLPMLLQLPIWWALYTSLSTNIELYHMPFTLWWTDLSAPDPFFVLPLALGALMHVQQRLTPTTMDPMQAKMMMWFMPIMITVFMLFLPSGLCLYMLTNSVLGISQQKFNEWRMSKQPALVAANVAATAAAADDNDDDDSDDNEPKRRTKRKRPRRTRRG